MSDAPMLARDGANDRQLFRVPGASLRELLSLRFQAPSLEAGFSRYCLPIALFQSRLSFLLACIFLSTDYVADSISYGLTSSPANLLRVYLIAPAFFGALLYSYLPAIKLRYELYVTIFYASVSSLLIYVIYLLDQAGGNGISNTVGFLNLFFILTFGFVLIGTRFYYSLGSSTIVAAVYTLLLAKSLGDAGKLYYFAYQIFTLFALCTLLGYTRELVLRGDFARQVELADSQTREREAIARQRQNDSRYLSWLRELAKFLRHEARIPVAQINSSIQIIQIACTNNDQLMPYVTSAVLGTEHVWNLIERASQATDAEAFVRQHKPEWTDVHNLLGEEVQAFRQSNAGIGFKLEYQTPVRVCVDSTLFKQAIGNLLSNAASFANEGSTVEVGLAVNEGHVTISVSNQGPPIGGDAEALFGPFASTRSGPSSEHHGLGLYLVRLIAEQHGGAASIGNLEDGSGVRATIRLPLPI
jgi:signal transduction histidine kinase